MAEICLDCFNKYVMNGEKPLKEKDVILEDDWCEDETVADFVRALTNRKELLNKGQISLAKRIADRLKNITGTITTSDGDVLTRREAQEMREQLLSAVAVAVNNRAQEGNPDTRYSFAGERAATADKSLLQQAQQMEQDGATPKEIWQETGWGKGADGKWRFEINDADMQLKKVEYAKMRHTEHGSTRLSDLISHKQLFDQYPHLAKMIVAFDDLDGASGQYSRTSRRITLDESLKRNESALKGVLIHELQHAIQQYESFAGGANVRYWQDRIDSKDVPLNEDFREKVTKARDQLLEIERRNPQMYNDVKELMQSLPPVPRGEFDFETFEEITPDPPEWEEFDRRRDELSEKYGEIAVFDAMSLFGKDGYYRDLMNGKSAYSLYYNTAGEIEARDAADRGSLDADERRRYFPRSMKPDPDRVFAENGVSYDVIPMASERQSSDTDILVEKMRRNATRLADEPDVFNIASGDIPKAKKASDAITAYFNAIGNVAVNPELGKVDLVKSGAKSTVFHGIGADKMTAVAAIKDVIEKGLIVDYKNNYGNRGYDTHVIIGKGLADNKKSIVGVIVKSYPNTNHNSKFYVHEVIKMEADTDSAAHNDLKNTVNMSASTTTISQSNPFVKENIRYSRDIKRAEQNKKDKAEFGISINQYARELMRDIGVPEEQTNEYLELALRHAAGLVKNGQSEAAVSALELINFSLSGDCRPPRPLLRCVCNRGFRGR